MNKTIKSGVRQLLFTMLCKYKQKQEEKEVLFKQKNECLNSITNVVENLHEDSDEERKALHNLQKLKQDQVLSQNKYFKEIASMTGVTHSEYRYGNCETPGIKFFTHVHLDAFQILGKIYVRGWLDIRRIPVCVVMRSSSHPRDSVRSTAYNFQMCVPRIVYCHTHRRYRYYYYEWHIPHNFDGGMNWDLYFYGSPWRNF